MALSKSQNWPAGSWPDQSFRQWNRLFREILQKTSLLGYYLGFDWSGWIVLTKSEILITTGMVWPFSSDKWKPSSERLSFIQNISPFLIASTPPTPPPPTPQLILHNLRLSYWKDVGKIPVIRWHIAQYKGATSFPGCRVTAQLFWHEWTQQNGRITY